MTLKALVRTKRPTLIKSLILSLVKACSWVVLLRLASQGPMARWLVWGVQGAMREVLKATSAQQFFSASDLQETMHSFLKLMLKFLGFKPRQANDEVQWSTTGYSSTACPVHVNLSKQKVVRTNLFAFSINYSEEKENLQNERLDRFRFSLLSK